MAEKKFNDFHKAIYNILIHVDRIMKTNKIRDKHFQISKNTLIDNGKLTLFLYNSPTVDAVYQLYFH